MYSGEFRKGLEHGEGELRDEHGALIYRGGFELGSICGRGTFYYTDGYVYGGEVREGLRHGKVRMFSPIFFLKSRLLVTIYFFLNRVSCGLLMEQCMKATTSLVFAQVMAHMSIHRALTRENGPTIYVMAKEC